MIQEAGKYVGGLSCEHLGPDQSSRGKTYAIFCLVGGHFGAGRCRGIVLANLKTTSQHSLLLSSAPSLSPAHFCKCCFWGPVFYWGSAAVSLLCHDHLLRTLDLRWSMCGLRVQDLPHGWGLQKSTFSDPTLDLTKSESLGGGASKWSFNRWFLCACF